MRKEALIGISVLLVMISGSATVLNSFGVISGEANVEEPTLWAAGGDELVLENRDLSTTGSATDITNGDEPYEYFKLNQVDDGAEWYKMSPEIYVELRSEEADGNPVNVEITFGNYEDSDRRCTNTIEVEGDEYEVYSTVDIDDFECQIGAAPGGNLELRVEMENADEEARINYTGDTKIEVISNE